MSRFTALDPARTQGSTRDTLAGVDELLGMTPKLFRVAAHAGEASDGPTYAILRFARTRSLGRGRVSETELAALRAAGVSDAEALEVIANVTLNVFTNHVNLVAGTDIDFPVVRAGEAA